MATKTLSVRLTLDIKGFTKKLKIATKQVSASMKKMGKSMSSLGKSLSLSITLPASIAGIAMIKLASDADEVNNKFNEIFGKSAPKTGQALDKIAQTIGRSSTELKEFAGNMGGVLSSMGFADNEAGKLSETMIQLGIDVGSFRNRSDSQVIKAFTCALVGEREALKSLGVSILESDVKLEALRLGLDKGNKILSKRSKVLATVSLLQSRFAKDAGDALRTADGFANVLKKFNSIAKQTGENLGKILLPAVTKILVKITSLIEAFDSMNERTKKWGLIILGLSALLGPILIVMGLMFQAIGAIAGGFLFLFSATSKAFSVFKLLGGKTLTLLVKTFGLMKTALLGVGKAVGGLLLKLAPIAIIFASLFLITTNFIKVMGILSGILADNAKVIVDKLGPAILIMLKGFKNVIKTVTFLKNIGKGFDEATTLAFNATKNITKSIQDLEKEINDPSFTGFSDNLKAEARKTETILFDMAKGMEDDMKALPQKVGDGLKKGFDVAKDGISKFGKDIGTGLKFEFDEIKDDVKNKFSGLLDDLQDLAFKKPVKIIFDSTVTEANPFGTVRGDGKIEKSPFGLATSGINPVTTGEGSNPAEVPQKKEPLPLTALQKFGEESQKISERFSEMWATTFEQFSTGFGDAIAGALLDGENLVESMKNLAKDMVGDMISSIVKMVTNWVIGQATMLSASGATSAGVAANNQITAATGAASSQASIPIIGPILALAAMAAMFAAVGAMAGGISLATGGITTGTTNALIGEAGQEAVIPLDKLDGLIGEKTQIINIDLDGRRIAESVIKNSPREIRLRTGVLM